ncbi:MAG: tripartite tricarboxylate transporter substrate-binding protein [Planctomycetota bacterium]
MRKGIDFQLSRRRFNAAGAWRWVFILLTMCCLPGCDAPDADGQYPTRPIKVVVPFGAGGGSDTVSRLLIKAIEEDTLLDQPMVVINVNGAGGTIGSRRVLNARPDGYTMLMLHDGILTAKYSGAAAYGPEAFLPVAGTGQIDMILTVREDSPFTGLRDLMAEAMSKPDTIACAANIGAPSHFVALLLENTAPGSRFRAGGIRGLCMFSEERHEALPDIPTAREQGFDVINSNMHFWWFPKGTPQECVDVMGAVLDQAMQNETVLKVLAESKTQPASLTGADLRASIDARTEAISKVSMRQTEGLPNFPLIVAVILVLLACVVVGGQLTVEGEVGAEAGGTVPRVGLALQCVAITLVYILAMGMDWVGYTVATILFVPIIGGAMSGWERKRMVGLGAVALVMGIGFYWLFTGVFVIDLP